MRSNQHSLSALMVAALACASGCADDVSARGESAALAVIDGPSGAEAGDAGSVDGGSDAGKVDGGLDASRPDQDSAAPEGAYFASITANGSGCPRGTWETAISKDGKQFLTTFTSYEVNINDKVEDPVISKNCVLSVLLRSPRTLSFSVKSLRISGYAFLEKDVVGSFWATQWFQGNPVPPSRGRNRVMLTGPFDSDYVFEDVIPSADAVWSPCGLERDLNINTTLQVKNSEPKRSGYMTVGSQETGAISVDLAWRTCEGATGAKR